MRFEKRKAYIYTLLKALQCEFFGFFVMLFFIAVRKAMGLFGNIMFGFTGLMCVVCIMADHGMKQGEAAGSDARLHDGDVKVGFGWLLGLLGAAPAALTSVLLLLSRAGVLPNLMGAYKILNAALYPTLDIFAHSAFVKDMPWAVFILILVYLALFPISTAIGFRLGYNRVDIKDKVMYKQN